MDAGAGAATLLSGIGNTATQDKHRPVVVGERWKWLKGYSILNFVWIVMSFVANANTSNGWFLLFLAFTQVATSVAQRGLSRGRHRRPATPARIHPVRVTGIHVSRVQRTLRGASGTVSLRPSHAGPACTNRTHIRYLRDA